MHTPARSLLAPLPRLRNRAALSRFALVPVFVLFAWACGGDDEESPAQRIAAACSDTCKDLAGSCVAVQGGAAACSDACEFAGALAPDCADQYEGYVDCAGERPVLTCGDDSVTVSGAALECIDPLASYLLCAADYVLNACVPVPSEDAACRAEDLGSTATVCATAPDGCQLLAGSLYAEGVGLFCCP